MNLSEKVRIILLEEFVKSQTRNPNYSMRAYSKKIGLAQPAISEMLSGKRGITKKSAEKILNGLDIDPEEAFKILSSEDEPSIKFQPLDQDAFDIIANWHHYAILSLAETKDFKSSEEWIAERLGITTMAASEAIEKLLQCKMLTRDSFGQLKPTGQSFEAISSVAKPALRKANRQNLELASVALEEVPLELRDFTAITLCLDPMRLEDARKMIKNFRRQFNRVMESGHKKEVYKLCVQLFPLSKRDQ
jgi:uncharacterized protein (TIGR02147 family)